MITLFFTMSNCQHKNKNKIIGVATFNGPNVFGSVTLSELDDKGKKVRIKANLTGLQKWKGKKAWHIHEAGDLRLKGCKGACSHFNPKSVNHGGPKDKVKHVGDLGNLFIDSNGNSKSSITVDFVRLRGKHSVMGRSIVIHEGEDDLGKGGDSGSLSTGNAGGRIGCAVIGYAEKSKLYF